MAQLRPPKHPAHSFLHINHLTSIATLSTVLLTLFHSGVPETSHLKQRVRVTAFFDFFLSPISFDLPT